MKMLQTAFTLVVMIALLTGSAFSQSVLSLTGLNLPDAGLAIPPDTPLKFQQTGMPDNHLNPDGSVGKKSVGTAFLLSLVLPGAGEWYLNKNNAARFFFGTEMLIWAGYLSNHLYTSHLENEFKVYAVQHADVLRDGKGVQYWIDIGKHDDIYSFNEQRRRERYFEAIYPETDEYEWSWDSREDRLRYDGKRLRANEIANQVVYFQAALLLNHMISGINALRLARKHNREMDQAPTLGMRFQSWPVDRKNSYFGVNFSAHF